MHIDNETNRASSITDHPALQLPPIGELAVAGWVDNVSWLSDDLLLIVGWFHAEEGVPLEAALVRADHSVPLDVRCMAYASGDQSVPLDTLYVSYSSHYSQLTDQIRDVVRSSLPRDATIIVISKGDNELLNLDGRKAWHFPQAADGTYAGFYPADSAEAIAHLEALRARGGDFLLLPSTALWWLDHYAEFKQHLEDHYRVVVRQEDVCLIFALREPETDKSDSLGPEAEKPDTTMPEADPRAGKILTARFLTSENIHGSLGSLVIRTGTEVFVLGPPDLSQVMTDLPTLVQRRLGELAAETRAEVMEFLALALKEYRGATNSFRLSKNLFIVREALRKRLPQAVNVPDQPQGLAVDTIMAIDETSFYMKGWVWDEEAEIRHLTGVSPEGSRAELKELIFHYPRPDIKELYGGTSDDQLMVEPGFISYFRVKAPSRLPTGWIVEMRNGAGVSIEAPAPRVIRDIITVRNTILGDLLYERLPGENLIRNHVYPAVSRLQERLGEMAEVESVVQYGNPNPSPDVSVIVPLYGRIDFLEHQLAQFVHDPAIYQADLIYVLDSPELAESLSVTAAQLFRLYRVPFRVVTLKRHSDEAAVHNVAASLARGRLLVLLNPHVLPDRPGWLGTMMTFYDSTPGIGALGAKLLYEDDSIHHAGIAFSRPPGSHLWEHVHRFQGLHRRLPAANITCPVPAVAGACLMIDRDLYEQLGGLRTLYLGGDYADADLCLRIIEAGRENWYLPYVELYYLEERSQRAEQSAALPLQQLAARYARWLYTHLWNEPLAVAMARYTSPTVGKAAASIPQY